MSVIVGPTLPEPYYGRIEAVWDDLVAEFGIERYLNPYPHVTLWPLDDGVELDRVEAAVRDAVAEHDPVPVQTDGIGVFPETAVWLPVSRSPELTALQRDVVEALEGIGEPPVPFYAPRRWFPHIGLALELGPELAGEVVTYLHDCDFQWSFEFETIAITRPPAGADEHELVAEIDL